MKKTSTHPTAQANRRVSFSTHQGSSREETGASKTGRGGAWVGGQKRLEASAHLTAAALQHLAQGGGHHLCPLRCGFSSYLPLLGGGLGQFWLISYHRPSHIRAQPLAAHPGHALNQRALVGGRLTLTVAPKTNRLRCYLQAFRQLCNAPGDRDGFLNCVHAANSTHVELTNLQLCL